MSNLTETEQSQSWQRPFFTIWIGQAISLLGSQLVQFALIWYITEETGSATALAGATLVALLPSVVLSPLICTRVDRGYRKRIMVMADNVFAAAALRLEAIGEAAIPTLR